MSDEINPAGFTMDRALQRKLLERMRRAFPDRLYNLTDVEWERAAGQMLYLEGHGLCDAGLSPNMSGGHAWTGSIITSAGLDFLESDGGLGAILGVVTVKLHADTVRDMLAAKIDASDLPPEKKSGIKAALRNLPSAALTAGASD